MYIRRELHIALLSTDTSHVVSDVGLLYIPQVRRCRRFRTVRPVIERVATVSKRLARTRMCARSRALTRRLTFLIRHHDAQKGLPCLSIPVAPKHMKPIYTSPASRTEHQRTMQRTIDAAERNARKDVQNTDLDTLGIRTWLRSLSLDDADSSRILALLNNEVRRAAGSIRRELARRRRHAVREALIRQHPPGLDRDDSLAAERRRRDREKARHPWPDHWRSY